ncbi:hypothetical protein GPECTOR_28g793 [Gonium pectorale]|uniref:ER membrane protein complex subunit 10 n=1 Tax=Gonium pectorale TaxID=33097 RepID=A0A150GEY4_GONPE|nr:hypothetical protein GPECTOR_28g793 [Gonium pectorale]|eukprot:KXZ48386.1 hypothetical protein GPECTOR_28g793 [Gonium pectorale]
MGPDNNDSELTWQRSSLSEADLALLAKAAKADGLYSVRVQTPKGALLTSVPAKCLRARDLKEQAELHADRSGALVGFTYAVPSCKQLLVAGAAGGAAAGGEAPALPERLPVRVVLPVPGPMLTQPELLGEFVDVSADAADLGSVAGSVSYDPNAKPRAAGGPGRAGKNAPPPDERTWLQKNWLFIAAGVMMVVNVLAKANAPPGPPGAPGAPGGGGGGGGGGDVSADAADLGSVAGSVSYDPNAKPRAAGGPGRAGKNAPPPDERTWLQKNWLFIAAGVMMVVNVLAKANAPPGPPGAPGAPGGGGGGGGGGGARRG